MNIKATINKLQKALIERKDRKMRWILFRGKRVIDGKWVDGCYITDEQDLSTAYIGHIFGTDGGGTLIHDMDIVMVDHETVCQYTGLTDKNGRKIFEGDIISKRVNIYSLGGMKPTGERMLVGTVIWDESSTIYPGGWSIKAKDEHGNDTVYAFDNMFEVIGNIFDNPELLEVENEID